MGGTKGQTTQATNQNQQYTADPRVQAAGAQALGQAQTAAASPFQMPQAPVAGFSPLQQQAFNQYQSLQNSWQPAYAQGEAYTAQSAAPITASDVNQYYNPMASNVTAQLQNIFGQQNQQNTASLVNAAGGVGADRIAVGQGNLANQQGLAAGQTYANLYQQALTAAQQQKQLEAGAGAQFQAFGQGTLGNNLQQTQALLGAGGQQQQQTQAQLNAPYQQQLAQIAYPFQTAQYLAGITGGLAPAFGGATNQLGNQVTTPPTPSALNQIVGLGAAGAGLYGAINGGFGGSGSQPGVGATFGGYGSGNTSGYGSYGGVSYPAFADGGGTDGEQEDIPGITGTQGLSPIPYIPLHAGPGHSGLTTGSLPPMPSAPSGGSQETIGGDIANVAGTAAKILPFFLKSGGQVKGYDDGGDTPIIPGVFPGGTYTGGPDPESLFANTPRPADAAPPFIPSVAPSKQPDFVDRFSDAQRQIAADLIRQGRGTTARNDSPVGTQPGGEFANPHPVPPGTVPLPIPYSGPDAIGSHPNAVPLNKGAPDEAEAPDEGYKPYNPPPNVEPYPATVRASQMPQSYAPYPDATKRDWGQNAARSPWLALVQAGAQIASTPGPIGSAIGKGLLSGTKTIEDQRKELRSEQELNDKAQQLYSQAQEHLDKYNNMTPKERADVNYHNQLIRQGEGDSKTQRSIATRAAGILKDLRAANNQIIDPAQKKSDAQMQQEALAAARYFHQRGEGAPLAGAAPLAGSDKPATIKQGDYTYTLQPDGTYK